MTDTVVPGPPPPPAPEPAPPPERPKIPRAPFILVAVVVLVMGIAVAIRAQDPAQPSTEASDGPYAGTEQDPRPRPDFTLTDTDGQPYDFGAETEGRLTLLFFGYTSCPDVCPLHMANLAYALEQPGVPRPLVVFVSVDPQRDTPEVIRSFLDRFDEGFVGLTGTPEQLADAQTAAGVAVGGAVEAISPGDDDYLVGHASQVIAYTAEDLSPVVYPFGVRQQDWIDDLPRLAEAGTS